MARQSIGGQLDAVHWQSKYLKFRIAITASFMDVERF